MQTIYFAGRCPWDAQAFVKMMLGLITTEAGRVSEAGENLEDAKCVKTTFDERRVTVTELMGYFFEITDPESVNRQGADTGEKYRTGVYSENPPPACERRRPTSGRCPTATGSASRCCGLSATSRVPRSTQTTWTSSPTTTATSPGRS